MNHNQGSEEIELVQLLVTIITTIKRNFILIVSFICIGTALGFLSYTSSKKVYENKMLISSEVIAESSSLLENLESLVKDGNMSRLATRLNLPIDVVQRVQSISGENIETEAGKSKNDEEDKKYYLRIIVRVYDQNILPVLQEHLVMYLDGSLFSEARTTQKKNKLSSIIKELETEISQLEAFKARIYKDDFSVLMNGNVRFDPTEINSKILELTKEKIECENKLALANNIQVVNGFVTFDKPISPKLTISLFIGFSIGLFLACGVIIFNAISKIMKETERNNAI